MSLTEGFEVVYAVHGMGDTTGHTYYMKKKIKNLCLNLWQSSQLFIEARILDFEI